MVEATKSMTVYKLLEKTITNKKITHGLHNMFYFERESIQAVSLLYLFVGICLPLCSFFIERYYLLSQNVAGVLHPPQFEPTWIEYRNNLIQVANKR